MQRAAGCVLLVLASSMLAQDGGVDLKTVKYDGLTDQVVKNRGKVVLIDFWASY